MVGLLRPLVAVAALGAPAFAQSIDELRQALRDNLADVQFARGLTGLVLLSDELELSGAQYDLDDSADTELWSLSLPFHTTFDVWGEDAPRLYVEGVAGYAEADQRVDDVYAGMLPALATAVDSEWRSYGALFGVGLQFEPVDDLTITPIIDLGLARLENDTDYAGPGADFTAALADGIAFNWDAYTWTAGGAVRADWKRPLGDEHELELLGRYDVRWAGVFDEDDEAQDFTSRMQLLTLRADVTGPTGLRPLDQPLGWRVTAGYRRFLEESLFDVQDYVELGAGLELDTGDGLPVVSGLTLSGAVIVGEDIFGWTVGLGATF